MSSPVLLRGWQWVPTWTLAANPADPNGPWIPTWSGREYLHDAEGRQVVELINGGGWGAGSGFAVMRDAPPPDRPVPTREEMEANRARKGLSPLNGGAA
ncbi:hypothetical protein FV242_27090 [Methylobacterium sp. WL64]|uniref:hypothetical protein n=1 Tax=Methylobacterium sp. WL64 TaxID=2603894 RepID=UPI0011C8B263|nr:hypothetical protein [Methylobacterium sp. WL64]TXM98958.1 hypothetical protein FV242_27090 [Methylobacterium sp. WL64]